MEQEPKPSHETIPQHFIDDNHGVVIKDGLSVGYSTDAETGTAYIEYAILDGSQDPCKDGLALYDFLFSELRKVGIRQVESSVIDSYELRILAQLTRDLKTYTHETDLTPAEFGSLDEACAYIDRLQDHAWAYLERGEDIPPELEIGVFVRGTI